MTTDDRPLIASVDELRRRHTQQYGDDPTQIVELERSLDEAASLHDAALEALHRGAGDRALNASEQRKWDGHARERDALRQASAELRHDRERQRDAAVAARRAKWGSLQVSANHDTSWDLDVRAMSPAGWVDRAHRVLGDTRGLSDRAREQLTETLTHRDGPLAGQMLVARSNPAYRTAFAKVLANPERGLLSLTAEESAAFNLIEQTRAAMGTGVGTAGYLIPLALDPNVSAITSAGIANPWRALSTVRTTVSSPARAITSPGITLEWLAEGAAFADASPTFGKSDVSLFKLSGWMTATFELFEDSGQALAEALPMLLADARDIAEGTAFATGDGSAAPKGLVTALAATAGSIVTATTRGSFTSASAVDLFALLNGLPARARASASRAAFANQTHITTVRSMVVGTAGVPVVAMSDLVPTPLGIPLHEASAMTSAMTSGSYLAVAADMAKYLIVDSIAGPSLEFVPVAFDQATGRPNGTRGWVFHSRVGADMLDPTQGRILKA